MPNVVLLISDEHNPFVSSMHGHAWAHTPNMQAIADRGAWFEHAYCPSPLCTPCRSSFMTGLHVHEHRMYSNCTVNTDFDHPTYGQRLEEQGICSVHVGKAHVYTDPSRLGFSAMHMAGGFSSSGDKNIRRRPMAVREGAAQRADGYGPRDNAFAGDEQRLDIALSWLRDTAPTLEQPWVLCVNLSKPHFPHYVTPELWERYADAGDLPALGRDCDPAQHPRAVDLRRYFETECFTEEQVRGLRRGYYGCVEFVDRALGQLRDALAELNLANSTNLIYTSDHGEMLGKFGMWWKCSLYEDSARVPLLATGPDYDSRGRVTTPVTLHDVQASLFASTGARRPDHWIGQPLQQIADHDPQRAVFSEYHGHGSQAGSYMIRRGDWKLIHHIDAPHQLFNLADDPDELRNVHDEHPERARELEAILHDICDPAREDRRAHEFQEAQLRTMEAAT